MRKRVFKYFLFHILIPYNRTMLIKKGGLIYLDDHKKIKDQNLKSKARSQTCCPRGWLLVVAVLRLLSHVVGCCCTGLRADGWLFTCCRLLVGLRAACCCITSCFCTAGLCCACTCYLGCLLQAVVCDGATATFPFFFLFTTARNQ